MQRLLVASVVLVCAFCQSAFGILLRGEATGVALSEAPGAIGVGDELTLTFFLDTEYPYHVNPFGGYAVYLDTPRNFYCISGAGLAFGYSGFGASDGGFVGPDSRMSMHISAPGIYGDPSVVLTPAMMPTAKLTFSQIGPRTNYQWAHYTLLQDAPITWYYVPEPSSYALGLLALGVLFVVRRK